MTSTSEPQIATARITAIATADVRFPTSEFLDGSDAMNPDPDYSAAYLEVRTDAADGLVGAGFVFTSGRGNDIQLAAISSVAGRLVGRELEPLLADLGGFWKELVYDSQLRWLGPEKGVIHMAIGAVVNALWDLKAKRAGLPLWQLLATMTPEELVALVDFRYLRDVLTPEQALEIFRAGEQGRAERIVELMERGYPAYTTSPGWLGYSDDKLARLCQEAVDAGFRQIKLKVGGNVDDDRRRFAIARQVVGDDIRIAVDANQVWETQQAIDWMNALAEFTPAWIEEPTNPDDVLAHAAISRGVSPIPVATGEHTANRVMFKQFLQADALQVMQIDATRAAGINENIANLLLAKTFDVPVCPHAGGVGLCEIVQHLAMFDYVAISATQQDRMIEYVDHLHEHFVTPVVMEQGNYRAPTAPGSGAQLLPDSIEQYRWSGER